MARFTTLLALVVCSTLPFGVYADGEYANVTPQSQATSSYEGASGDQLASAVGHYARSRSLLIEAIREFDRGTKIANPDSILNSEEWRNSLVSRAEDLERILAPQPRVSKGGVKFQADTRLLNVTNK